MAESNIKIQISLNEGDLEKMRRLMSEALDMVTQMKSDLEYSMDVISRIEKRQQEGRCDG